MPNELALSSSAPTLWLNVPNGQSFDEWRAVGEQLFRTERVLNWWIGDWWAAGSHRYGQRAKAAAEGIFGLSFSSLANAASVCRAFETSRRRELLPWSAHVEVAALPAVQADALLDRAEHEGLSARDLRVEVKRLRSPAIVASNDDEPADTSSFLRRAALYFAERLGSCRALTEEESAMLAKVIAYEERREIRDWTDADDALLLRLSGRKPLKYARLVAAETGRSEGSVRSRLRVLKRKERDCG